MAPDAYLLPEDNHEERPILTKSSFRLVYSPCGRVEAYCGSGVVLVNPLYSIFCEHVVDASILPPGKPSFTCPHKGCGEAVPRCDTRELSRAEVFAAIDNLHPKLRSRKRPHPGSVDPKKPTGKTKKEAKGNVTGKKKKRVPPPPLLRQGTRRSPRNHARNDEAWERHSSSSKASPSSSPPPSSQVQSASPNSSTARTPATRAPTLRKRDTRNARTPVATIVLSSDSEGTPVAARRQRRGLAGGGTQTDPIVID